MTKDGGINFSVHPKANSPVALAALTAATQSARRSGELSIQIPVPLLKNQHLISVGFITAAYLLWFHDLGYSWAFQSHLDPVRNQIQRPETLILPKTVVACGKRTFSPSTGVGYVGNEFVIVTALSNWFVLFPSADNQSVYDRLRSSHSNGSIERLRGLTFPVWKEGSPHWASS